MSKSAKKKQKRRQERTTLILIPWKNVSNSFLGKKEEQWHRFGDKMEAGNQEVELSVIRLYALPGASTKILGFCRESGAMDQGVRCRGDCL